METPRVLGNWRELVFITRALGSAGNYLRGVWSKHILLEI